MKNNIFSSSRSAGFTLIEVLVALVILAIALPAIIKATSDSIHGASHIRDKTAAHWVALNVMARLQLGVLPVPDSSGEKGVEQQFGVNYYWNTGIDSAETPYALRIFVEVRSQPTGPTLERIVGFLHPAASSVNELNE